MRVLLDTTYARRAPYSGTGIYLSRISPALSAAGVDVIEVANERRRAPAGGGVGSARNLASDSWWALRELPRLARSMGAELIHHPLPAQARAPGLPQVITVHDLAFERFPELFDRGFRTFAHRAHRAAASAAQAVICVSNTTAGDVESLWGIPAERLVVALHGPGQELPARVPAPSGGYFLYVGDDERRKNLPALREAYSQYRVAAANPLELVLAGSISPSLTESGIRVERDPRPERLAELYSGAAALVHPSAYEGFGLTALEAMSLGIPVLAAPAPAIAELCGEAARYADPGDPPSFAAALAYIASTPALRRELARRGRGRAMDYSWAASARAHVDAYSLALAG